MPVSKAAFLTLCYIHSRYCLARRAAVIMGFLACVTAEPESVVLNWFLL